ncbi:MAG: cyclase family protein, partial [Mycolicibacterium sp.]|nr:cyclase family protein [Mycolicibacterium sp.]
MANLDDFRRVADDVRNWGRWGADDEIGTLNFITADKVAEAAATVRKGAVISLGGDFGSSGPQGAFKFRQNPVHVMTVDGGDANTLVQ